MVRGGLYIHIPFCVQKCLYCDFPSIAGTGEATRAAYVAALECQIALWRKRFPSFFPQTIFIGGGTPSLLTEEELRCLVAALERADWWQGAVERSIEANPGTVTSEKLRTMHALGINRISFGVQSFSNRLLAAIGRIHTAADAVEAVDAAAASGFQRISVDLMYGLPGQTIDDWTATLEQALRLPVEHISAYALTVEEDTPLAERVEHDSDYLPDDDSVAAMQELVLSKLAANNFERYEISNFAKAGAVCLHNMGYWRYRPYLGLGAAAVSTWRGRRWRTTSVLADYLRDAGQNHFAACEQEILQADIRLSEYIFLGLRTTEGISLSDANRRFGMCFQRVFATQLATLQERGWCAFANGRLRLTTEGMKWGNQAFSLFLPE